jgi:AraC family transcriptional regulator
MMEFMGAFFKQGLKPAGGPFAIYFNNPGQVPEAELKWLIGMPIAPAAAPVDPLKKGEFNHPKVAVCVHVGPYDKVGETYAKMIAFIDQNGWKVSGPPMEKYIDNPQMVAPDKLRTELVLPVEKK